MQKYLYGKILLIGAIVVLLSSCSSMNTSMRETNARVEFVKSDFTLSDQVTGGSSVTRVFGVDWERLFSAKKGEINIIGDRVSSWNQRYALYDLMSNNTGYDVIFYPSYEIESHNYLIFSTTKVKVSARLGKLNK